MALSEFYESTIIEVRADFGFGSFDCDPREITATLGIDPDEVRYKGQERTTRTGHVIKSPMNSWSLSSRSKSKDINAHLRELFSRLEGVEGLFSPRWGEASFGVLWKGSYLYAGNGPFYEPDVVAGIARFGAALSQDIYQVDQDDSEIENKSGFRRIPRE